MRFGALRLGGTALAEESGSTKKDWSKSRWAFVVGVVASLVGILVGALALFESAEDRTTRKVQEHRAQAKQVTTWFERGLDERSGTDGENVVQNASSQPVYDLVTNLIRGTEAGVAINPEHRAVLSVVPPGTWEVPVPMGWGSTNDEPGAEIGFTDRFGSLGWAVIWPIGRDSRTPH